MSTKKNAVLIIDAQFDFCDPKGALFVAGADKDMERLGSFIEKNKASIDYVGLTMDSHHVNDISHPSYWQDKDGNYPQPFTIITKQDVNSGKWSPRFYPNESVKYIEELESQGEFPHCIWPEHCVIGSKGASFVDSVMDAVKSWSKTKGSFYQVVTKGTHPRTEHFGAFRANVPVERFPETQMNMQLIQLLNEYENVYFAGEAKSHCVANTLKQAMQFPDLIKKFVILEDCMSNVTGFERIAENIYKDAKDMGARFSTSNIAI